MRISDWSSDVCSSDLSAATSQAGGATSAGGRARTIRRPPAPWSSSRDARHPLPEKFPVPGSVERMGRSVLVVPWPVRLHQLLLHLRGHRFVVAEIQRIATAPGRSEEHTSELQSLMRISYAVFCLKKKTPTTHTHSETQHPTDQ